MMDLSNMMELCRLCLDRDRETISIFEGEGVDRNICEKIGSCLPVKVSRDDPLPKKICDDCTNKVELVYSFWNTTSSAEKQLLEWLGLNDTDSEAPAEMLKTEMVLFKEESDENDMIAELTHMANSGLADDSQCIIENEPDAAEDSDDEESEGEESHGEEGQAEEDPGGGVSEQPKLPSINLSSMVSAVAGALNSSIEAGPSGLQLPETTSSQPAPQPPVLPQQTPDLQSIVGLDSPRSILTEKANRIAAMLKAAAASGSLNRVTRTFPCPDCDLVLPSRQRLNQHYKVHHEGPQLPQQDEQELEEEGERAAAVAAAIKVEVHSGSDDDAVMAVVMPVYKCKLCNKEFSSEKSHRLHQIVHSEERPYTCNICYKSYKRPYEMKMHQRKHSEQKRLQCSECDYSTIYKSALTTHKRRHNQEYKYHCDICGKGFFVMTWLMEHKNFHTGEKPYQCDVCGKAFPYTRYLTAHKKTLHPDAKTTPKVHECGTCGKTFAHRNSLSLHIKSHTGENVFICDICGKSLTNKEHLNLHRRIHTGEKPHSCAYCGKAFSKPGNLTLHERVHTGERPYKCDTCGKAFSQRSTLVIHKRYHTGQRPYECAHCQKTFVCKALLTNHIKNRCFQ